jgi:hypothetical protein
MRTAAGFFSMEWPRCACEQQQQWTPEEDKRLLELQAAGKSSVAAELRRSVGAVHGGQGKVCQ